MKVFYRISDNGYIKPKLREASKTFCLDNFLDAFPKNLITVIADRCNPDTIEMVKLRKLHLIETNLGNAGSYQYALDEACKLDDVIYFVEDDYLHKPDAERILLEGFSFGDYITLYDHPDKYTKIYSFGEISKVSRGGLSHWRYTQSTCMTFAAKSSTLRQDREIWDKHTKNQHPYDHESFTELQKKGRKIAVCIPGSAIHVDISSPESLSFVEPWAIRLLIGAN